MRRATPPRSIGARRLQAPRKPAIAGAASRKSQAGCKELGCNGMAHCKQRCWPMLQLELAVERWGVMAWRFMNKCLLIKLQQSKRRRLKSI